MSRMLKLPIELPDKIDFKVDNSTVVAKGPKGQLSMSIPNGVTVNFEENKVKIASNTDTTAVAGTVCALIKNMIVGVKDGFTRELSLVGVGYRAQMKGNVLNLNLGYSHPIEYSSPEGIEIETPSQTEILVKGADKQKVGQVASEIRGFRAPEPYKGKGVRYKDEHIVKKEAKKK